MPGPAPGHAGPPGRVLGDAGRSAPPGGAGQKNIRGNVTQLCFTSS